MKLLLSLYLLSYISMLPNLEISNDEVEILKKVVFPGEEITHLDIAKIGRVVVLYGEENKVEIHADSKEINEIKYKLSGKKLKIYSKKSVAANHSTIYVTTNVKSLSSSLTAIGALEIQDKITHDQLSIEGKSVGNISIDCEVNNLTIDMESIGTITVKGTAGSLNTNITAGGTLDFDNVTVQSAYIKTKAVSSILLNVEQLLKIDTYATPQIRVRGTADIDILHKDPSVKIEII